MARRLVESLNGVGGIFANEIFLRAVPYELSLWSDDEQAAPGGQPGRVTSIDGHIDIMGIAEAVVLVGPEKLTLQLEDGRRLQIKLTNTGGAIEGLGELSGH